MYIYKICDIVICGFSFNVKMKAAGENDKARKLFSGSGWLASLTMYNKGISIYHLLSSRVADSHNRACSSTSQCALQAEVQTLATEQIHCVIPPHLGPCVSLKNN